MSKIKQFFRQSGLTKAQLLASALCYFFCFALFLGIVVIWNPNRSEPSSQTRAITGEALTMGDGSIDYWISDPSYYSLDWYNNAAEGVGDSEANPYLISSAADLAGLSYLVYANPTDLGYTDSYSYIFQDKYFKQTANIDLSAHTWQPIGIECDRSGNNVNHYFSGNYYGGGFTISGLNTPAGNTPAYSNQGLFGVVHVENTAIPAILKSIGIISTPTSPSHVQGYNSVASVVATGYGVEVTNCYNTADVSGNDSVDGIGGSRAINCYNTGNISGNSYVSGISSNAYYCYNAGNISGNSYVAGISSNLVFNCFNVGQISAVGQNAYLYPLTSSSFYPPVSSYYGGPNLEEAADGNGTFIANLDDLVQDETWLKENLSWDFSFAWKYDTASSYLYPQLISSEAEFGDWWLASSDYYDISWYNNPDTATFGDGSESNPYKISTAEQLAGLSYLVYTGTGPSSSDINGTYIFGKVYFVQTSDIDLSAHVWQPIGIYYDRSGTQTQHYFSGNYDGGGYTVSGIMTPEGASDAYSYQGLFGYSDYNSGSNTIKRIGITNSDIRGYISVGAIVGGGSSSYGSYIDYCYNTADVTTFDGNGGGIAGGSNRALFIRGCYNTGTITTRYPQSFDYSGGIAGSGNVAHSFNIGAVSSEVDNNYTSNPNMGISAGTITLSYYGGACQDFGDEYYISGLDSLVQTQEWLEENLSWDFSTVWKFDTSAGNPYPVLRTDDEKEWWLNYIDTTWAGEGTEENPYQITSEEELAGIAYSSYVEGLDFGGVYFELTTDLDLSAHAWVPIGQRTIFMGAFDGNGHTISGLTTLMGFTDQFSYQGLFGQVQEYHYTYVDDSGTTHTEHIGGNSIKNVHLVDVDVKGYRYIGGLVGWFYGDASNNSIIENCSVTGSILGYPGYYSYSYYTTNSQYVGGIAGYGRYVFNSYNRATVTASGDSVGGIAGYGVHIANCYNTGSINGGNFVAGVLGYGGYVYNCFSTGTVSGTGSFIGGVLAAGTNPVYNSYYGNSEMSDFADGNGTFLSNLPELAKTQKWFMDSSNWYSGTVSDHNVSWDFFTVWMIDAAQNDGYPILMSPDDVDWWLAQEDYYDISWYNNSDTDTYGDGSESNPYKISTAEQLAGLSYLVYYDLVQPDSSPSYNFSNTYFVQTQNIDLSAHGWQPIGIQNDRQGSYANNWFSGNYDGGGFTITGLRTPAGSTDAYSYQGLFGYVYAEYYDNPIEIKNITVEAPNVQGYMYVGAIAGMISNGVSLTNCHVVGGSVTALDGQVGGIAGYVSNRDSQTTNLTNSASVTGGGSRAHVGGIFGYINTTLTNSHNSGTITFNHTYLNGSSQATIGGLVGYGNVSDSYNTGAIVYNNLVDPDLYYSHDIQIGGLVGGEGSVTNSYNLGNITVNYNRETQHTLYVGGLIGYAGSSYDMVNSYNFGDISLNISSTVLSSAYVGGLAGYSYGSISSSYNAADISYALNTTASVNIAGIAAQSGSISDVFTTGLVTAASGNATTPNLFGITQSAQNTVTNAYYYASSLGDDYGQQSSTLLTDAKTQSWYDTNMPGFDFLFLWVLKSEVNEGYPSYKGADDPIVWWLGNDPETGEAYYDISWFTDASAGRGDSASDPYIIADAADLAGLSYLVYYGEYTNSAGEVVVLPTLNTMLGAGGAYFAGKYFKQMANIDLSGLIWQPIGVIYHRITGQIVDHAFSGIYDGGGYTVSGIETAAGTKDSYSMQGLFGYVSGAIYESAGQITTAEIKNVTVANSEIQGVGVVGGVVGLAVLADIENVQSYANITLMGDLNDNSVMFLPETKAYAAGVVGALVFGNINGAIFGGFVNVSLSAVDSLNPGLLSGIIGHAYSSSLMESNFGISSGKITNCYNYGQIGPKWDINLNDFMAAPPTDMTEEEMLELQNSMRQLSASTSTGIVSTAGGVTISDSSNFGRITGMAVSGILTIASSYDFTGSDAECVITIDNCMNAGSLYGVYYLGGLVCMGIDILGGGSVMPTLVINDSASVGKITVIFIGESGEGIGVGGVLAQAAVNSGTQITNTIVNCEIVLQTPEVMVGGVGVGFVSTSEVMPTFIKNCFIDITITNDGGDASSTGMLDCGMSGSGLVNLPDSAARNTYGVFRGDVVTVEGDDYAFVYQDGTLELTQVGSGETISSKTIEINGVKYIYDLYTNNGSNILTLTAPDGSIYTSNTITLGSVTYMISYDYSSDMVTLTSLADGSTYTHGRYNSFTINGVNYTHNSFSYDSSHNNIPYYYQVHYYDETNGSNTNISNNQYGNTITIAGTEYSFSGSGNSLTLTNGGTSINNDTTITIGEEEYAFAYENGSLTLTPVAGGAGIQSHAGFTNTFIAFVDETEFENSFVYLDSFNDGMPIVLKSDGTPFYHILNFGSTTGVFDKIQEFIPLPPNILSAPLTGQSVVLGEGGTAPADIWTEQIDLNLQAGKTYTIYLTINGEKYSASATAQADGNMITLGMDESSMIALSDSVAIMWGIMENTAYTPEIGNGFTEDLTSTLFLFQIIDMSTNTLIQETVTITAIRG